MPIQVTPSTYQPKVGEIVRFTGSSSVTEDIILKVVEKDTNTEVAQFTIYLATNGTNFIDIIPSQLGTHLRVNASGAISGATQTFDLNVGESFEFPWASAIIAGLFVIVGAAVVVSSD